MRPESKIDRIGSGIPWTGSTGKLDIIKDAAGLFAGRKHKLIDNTLRR